VLVIDEWVVRLGSSTITRLYHHRVSLTFPNLLLSRHTLPKLSSDLQIWESPSDTR